MMELSVVIISRNEEENIRRCIQSVSWADEVILVDSQSTDRTREIAGQLGVRIFSPPWRGFGHAKREAVKQARGKWILSIDADEVVSSELAREIKDVMRDTSGLAGFYIPRRTNFLGRWIRHCGWYPDRVLRLFLKSRGDYDEATVHEKVILDGPVGNLAGELLHYSYPSLEHYLDKFNHYTTLGAEEAYRRGRRTRWPDIVLRPPVAFIKHYISRQGFRDGLEGFIISVMSSIAVLVKYAKLRHLGKKDAATEGDSA
ncbi:MAG: glycosyltransferase family 2 protein [bacterium]